MEPCPDVSNYSNAQFHYFFVVLSKCHVRYICDWNAACYTPHAPSKFFKKGCDLLQIKTCVKKTLNRQDGHEILKTSEVMRKFKQLLVDSLITKGQYCFIWVPVDVFCCIPKSVVIQGGICFDVPQKQGNTPGSCLHTGDMC